MDMRIELTEDMILAANDYVPIVQKYEMAQAIAQECVAHAKMNMQREDGTVKALPDRVQEAQLKTNLYLMGVLAKHYLKIPYEGMDDMMGQNPYYGLQMPANIYDQFAASHVMNQLEQMKTCKAVKDKVYNILYDYRKFQRMLNAEIEIVVGHQNDVVWRMLAAMEMDMKEAVFNELGTVQKPQSEQSAEPMTDEEKIAAAKEKLAKFRETVHRMAEMEETLSQKVAQMEAAGEKADA